MAWRVLTDRELMQRVAVSNVTCIRWVCLSPVGGGPGLDAFVDGSITNVLDQPFQRKYALRAFDTDPATVAVTEGESKRHVGMFVWDGPGKITAGRDPRLVQLADALDQELSGSSTGVEWQDVTSTCPDCGIAHDMVTIGEPVATDVEVEPGLRFSAESIDSPEKMLVLMGQYGSDRQLATCNQLIRNGCLPVSLGNVRASGGPDVQHFVVFLEGPGGEFLSVLPDGTVEADF